MSTTTFIKVGFGSEIFSNTSPWEKSVKVLDTFGKCLRFVRKNRFLNQKGFAILTDTDRSLISRYERDLDTPSDFVLNKIFKPLSPDEEDFLRKSLKRKPTKNNLKTNNVLFDKNQFSIRLKKIRNIKKLTQIELSKISGIYHGNIAKYERSFSTPSLENAILLADSLGVTIDLLLRGSNTNSNNKSKIDSSLVQTFNQLSRCNENEKNAVILLIDSAIKGFRK